MEFIPEEGKALDSNCSTLILPALSIGNVGQLTVDLLVSSTKSERIGYLDDPLVLPCVGNDAYGPNPSGDLALPLEVYDSSAQAFTLVQQRSPIVQGKMVEYAKNLANFAASTRRKHVIILSSMDSGKRQRIDALSDKQIYYISSSSEEGNDEYEKLGWKRLPEYCPDQRGWTYLTSLAEGNSSLDDSFGDEMTDEDYYPSLPFAALFCCCKAKGLKTTCILKYCSEGDNIPDAFQLADAACKLLSLSTHDLHGNGCEWTVPLSWKTVYGPPPEMSMF